MDLFTNLELNQQLADFDEIFGTCHCFVIRDNKTGQEAKWWVKEQELKSIENLYKKHDSN